MNGRRSLFGVALALFVSACAAGGPHSGESRDRVPARASVPAARVFALGRGRVCLVRDGRVLCAGRLPDAPRDVRERAPFGSQFAIRASSALRPVAGLTDVVEIANAGSSLCALRRDGSVVCTDVQPSRSVPAIGADAMSALGALIGSNGQGSGPRITAEVARDVVRLVDGSPWSLYVVKRDGSLVEVALTAPSTIYPTRFTSGIIDAVATSDALCALDDRRAVRCDWPLDTDPRLRTLVGRGARAISVNGGTILVIDSEHRLWESTYDERSNARGAARRVVASGSARTLNAGCAFLGDGSVRCVDATGSEVRGADGLVLAAVDGFAERAIVCGLEPDGDVRCAGDDFDGFSGSFAHAMRGPVAVRGVDDAVAISVGLGHGCALREGGRVSCWGLVGPVDSATPVDLDLAEFGASVAIASTAEGACALSDAGYVSCWGSTGSVGDTIEPLVEGAYAIAGGAAGICALRVGGAPLCLRNDPWGSRRSIDRAPDSPRVPARPAVGFEGASELAIGAHEICGRVGGRARCDRWVFADEDHLASPMSPPPSASADAVVPGGDQICWRSRGRWSCSGHNGVGQLGIAPSRPVEGSVPLGDHVAVASSTHRICGITRGEGFVECAGTTEAGDPRTEADRGVGARVRVPGVERARVLSVSPVLACAIVDGGQVLCWGDGFVGALGDGIRGRAHAPFIVPVARE